MLDDFVLGQDGSALALPDRDATLSGDNADEQVQASFRAPGAGFGALEEVSGPQDRTDPDADFNPAAGALGPSGHAIVAWPANDGSGTQNERIFVSERDGTPPAVTGVSVPAQAVVQTRVAMAATVVDSQSAATVRWDFGDGSQATASAVTHAYGVAGAYLVTITAVDAFGNSTSETRVVTITSPASGDQSGTPPVISHLRSAHRRFRIASADIALIAARHRHRAPAVPAGTVFSLDLSQRATLVFSVSGEPAGRHSVTPPPFIRSGRGPGVVTIAFSGRIGGVRLAPGTYRHVRRRDRRRRQSLPHRHRRVQRSSRGEAMLPPIDPSCRHLRLRLRPRPRRERRAGGDPGRAGGGLGDQRPAVAAGQGGEHAPAGGDVQAASA